MSIKPWDVPGQKRIYSSGPGKIILSAINSLNIRLSLAPTIRLQSAMISNFAHYSMLVLYGLISYGIICPLAMPTILSLWTNMLLFIFMMSLLFAIWSLIACYLKTGVFLKWTLWIKTESPLFTFEIEPTRHWTFWDEKWEEEEQAENEEPETIHGWDETPAWDEITAFNNENLNPENNGPDGWNAEEWDQQQQNLTWLDTGGMAVPDFIITALANIDHFREEASAWLTLHIPVLTISSEPKETAPQITEIPSENESEPENPFPDNEPIPSFQFNWPPDNIGHMESDS